PWNLRRAFPGCSRSRGGARMVVRFDLPRDLPAGSLKVTNGRGGHRSAQPSDRPALTLNPCPDPPYLHRFIIRPHGHSLAARRTRCTQRGGFMHSAISRSRLAVQPWLAVLAIL